MKYKNYVDIKTRVEIPLDFLESTIELFYMSLTDNENKTNFNYYDIENVEDNKIKSVVNDFIEQNTILKNKEKQMIKLLEHNLEKRLKQKYDYEYKKMGEYLVQSFYKK